MPVFIKKSLHAGARILLFLLLLLQQISSFLWFNTHYKIGRKSICTTKFSHKNLYFVGELFELFGNINSWEKMKGELDLLEHLKFYWAQLINAILRDWKESTLEESSVFMRNIQLKKASSSFRQIKQQRIT